MTNLEELRALLECTPRTRIPVRIRPLVYALPALLAEVETLRKERDALERTVHALLNSSLCSYDVETGQTHGEKRREHEAGNCEWHNVAKAARATLAALTPPKPEATEACGDCGRPEAEHMPGGPAETCAAADEIPPAKGDAP